MTMTTCSWAERDELFEGYVRDALSPDDRDAFEEHFFSCPECADKLETYRALQAELRALPSEVPAPQAVFAPAWRWALVPVAACLVLVAAVALWLRSPAPATPESTVAVAPAPPPPAAVPALQPSPPAPVAQAPGAALSTAAATRSQTTPKPKPASPPVVALSVLARVEPPLYIPLALRGPRDEAAEKFDAGMRRYVGGDFAGAMPDLAAAADLNPSAARITFFLAICRLVTDQTDTAVDGLQKTIALGDSPYLEEAHYYLAKARLRQGDLQAAQTELRRTIERRGRLEREARRLLAQVEALARTR